MRADDEACGECGVRGGQPHRLRCSRQFDEQLEAQEFEQSGGVQGALIAGVVVGILALVVVLSLGQHLAFALGEAAALGFATSEGLRRIAEARRDANAKRQREAKRT